jgi:hypothetical protein
MSYWMNGIGGFQHFLTPHRRDHMTSQIVREGPETRQKIAYDCKIMRRYNEAIKTPSAAAQGTSAELLPEAT